MKNKVFWVIETKDKNNLPLYVQKHKKDEPLKRIKAKRFMPIKWTKDIKKALKDDTHHIIKLYWLCCQKYYKHIRYKNIKNAKVTQHIWTERELKC